MARLPAGGNNQAIGCIDHARSASRERAWPLMPNDGECREGGADDGWMAEDEMTAAERPISEDELHGYVDGRLEAARRQEVERYLDAQPELSRRVAAYRAQRHDLRAALAGRAA